MRNLRVTYQEITFPHYVKYQHSELTHKQTGEEDVYDKNGRKTGTNPIINTVMKSGTFNLIVRPDDHVKIGEQLQHPLYKGLCFEVKETLETRPANGDWSFCDFKPELQIVSVELVN